MFFFVSNAFNMEGAFFGYLKPLLRCCNLLGITYVTSRQSESITVMLPSVSLMVLYVFCVCTRTPDLNMKISKVFHTQVLKVGDYISMVCTACYYSSKWLYYVTRRRQVKQLIFEARLLQGGFVLLPSLMFLGVRFG